MWPSGRMVFARLYCFLADVLSSHPLREKLVFRLGKTHTQGKDLDSGLDLHWKAEASKNIRGEVACILCDTVVMFQCQIRWMSFAGGPLVISAGARPQIISKQFKNVLLCVSHLHISDACKPERLKSAEWLHQI